jgi:hypothetical protein
MPANLVLANGDGRFNTDTRPTLMCAAKSRPPASYSWTIRRSASFNLMAAAERLDPLALERKAAEEARRPWAAVDATGW